MGDYYGHSNNTNGPPPQAAPPKPAVDAGKIFVGGVCTYTVAPFCDVIVHLDSSLLDDQLCDWTFMRRFESCGTFSHSLFILIILNTTGLSWQTSEESLRFHFEQYGTVLSVEVMRDRVTGDPRGFAFVVFSDPSTVDLVMAEERHEINHKIVDVKRAQARGVAPPSIHGGANPAVTERPSRPVVKQEEMTAEQAQAKVFVGGIPPHVDREELRAIFSQFGPVTDAIVMVDQATQRSRGFGFVTFEHDSDGGLKAVEAQPLQIHGRRVEVKLATPRAEQQRRPPAAGPKHVGLRAGQTTSTGEFAGLAVAYGRSGWKAGYGSKAFGKAGWAVQGWDDGGAAPERSGFSFQILRQRPTGERPAKRSRH